jgi:general secretion pathway protein A
MYTRFFGFKEKPFKLVPSPAYLFLSQSHEEALAYLNYATSQGDGFVEITGEVGTGKTTLCRAFLESLDSDTEAAYIFNPRLGPKQLLQAINDEFGINSDFDSTKNLIDVLNRFLMRRKSERKKVLILIDEAQNLNHHVLEQLRLLSNLETSNEKLLQIILVGQPELAEKLESYELRQLGQRITLKYHLTPLTASETRQYIQFRINIASQRNGIRFDKAAFRRIHNYSGGIPRLINIACDRALLTAFGLNQRKISASIAKKAIEELSATIPNYRRTGIPIRKAALGFVAVALAVVALISYRPIIVGIRTISDTQPPALEHASVAADSQHTKDRTIPNPHIDPSPPQTQAPPAVGKTVHIWNLADYLKHMNIPGSRYAAMRHALRLWRGNPDIKPYLSAVTDDQVFFRLSAKPSGLFVSRIESDFPLLKKLNLPAILEFFPPGSDSPGYLTLSKIEDGQIRLCGATDSEIINTDAY